MTGALILELTACDESDEGFSIKPGSDEALDLGCRCPIDQPTWPKMLIHKLCPVHRTECKGFEQ